MNFLASQAGVGFSRRTLHWS